jgi:phage-related protein
VGYSRACYPYTSQLDGRLRELRFYCGQQRVRLTYFITGERRIIMLTQFVKTKQNEAAEVARARRAMAECIAAGHTVLEES